MADRTMSKTAYIRALERIADLMPEGHLLLASGADLFLAAIANRLELLGTLVVPALLPEAKESAEADTFYILSLKWTRKKDRVLTWWAPENKGYHCRIALAGKYTKAQVDDSPDYYANGADALPIPCAIVDRLARFNAIWEGPCVDFEYLAMVKTRAYQPETQTEGITHG